MRITKLVLLVAVVAALLLVTAGPGSRLGLWPFGTGFLLLRWALYLGAGAAVLALVMLIIPKTRASNASVLVAAALVGLATAWVPYSAYRTARSVPPIHDITSNTSNPPAFVAILPLRANASNPPEYMGEEIAKQQREAYPDIQTLRLNKPAAEVFRAALKSVQAMGWDVVAEVPDEGRIEATITTFWFGFKDDVVIRIVGVGDSSELDIRSKSRVGRSDLGANAARIRRFFSELESTIQAPRP